METLQEIQDELAKEIGYQSLEDYLYELIDVGIVYTKERIVKYINELSARVQQEQQKVIAKKAKVKRSVSKEKKTFNWIEFEIDKSSIINENNIIR